MDLVPLWLSGVRVSAENEEAKLKLLRFQEEATSVLREAFQDGRLTGDVAFDELLRQDSETVQAYKVLLATVKLVRQ